MSKVTTETLSWAYKPFDVVTDKKGNVGFIEEVNVNECQDEPKEQISYAVNWLTGKETKNAWFDHSELESHCNLLIKIAERTCHPMGNNSNYVKRLIRTLK